MTYYAIVSDGFADFINDIANNLYYRKSPKYTAADIYLFDPSAFAIGFPLPNRPLS